MGKFRFKPHDAELISCLLEYVHADKLLPAGEAAALAARFDVAERTVYRRLKACRTEVEAAEMAAMVSDDAATVASVDTVASWPFMTSEVNVPVGEVGPDLSAPTVLELLETQGPSAFRFDWELTGIAYANGGNIKWLWEDLKAAGFPVPSYTTCWRRWQKLTPLIRDAAKNGVKRRAKLGLHIRHAAANANDVWQLDAFHLDIVVRVRVGKRYERLRPTLLLLIDDYSRACVGWALTYRSVHAADVKALFGEAFEVRPDEDTGEVIGGVPQCLIVDNEAAIVAAAVRDAVHGIPMAVRPAPTHTPIAKGKIERAGKTIQAMIVTGQPGVQTQSASRSGDHWLHADDKDLFEEVGFLRHVAAEIAAYNDKAMKALGGKRRKVAYLESLAAAGGPRAASDDVLAELMLPVGYGGKRLVSNTGIEVAGHFYLARELGMWLGSQKKLPVRRWHHRLSHVAVFDPDGRFLAMAKRVDLLTDDERARIVADRHQNERAAAMYADQARSRFASVAKQRELDAIGEDETGPAAVSPSPVPPSSSSGTTSKKARPTGGRGNAPSGTRSKPRAVRPQPVNDDEAERTAREQLAKKFERKDQKAS
jgi:transposase InsO family protein